MSITVDKHSWFQNVQEIVERKPLLRGWLHVAMIPISIVLGAILISVAPNTVEQIASTIFTITAVILFSGSSVYHRFYWTPQIGKLLLKIDYANIFLLIAGSYTPIAVTALSTPDATILLGIAWSGAIAGALLRIFWTEAPRWLGASLYVLLGWIALFFLPQLFVTNSVAAWLLIIGGLAYTLGAVAFATRKPNLLPAIFGHHELFHAGTVIGFGLHWTAMLLLVV